MCVSAHNNNNAGPAQQQHPCVTEWKPQLADPSIYTALRAVDTVQAGEMTASGLQIPQLEGQTQENTGQGHVPQHGMVEWGARAQFQPLPLHSRTISQISSCSTGQCSHHEKHLAGDAAQMFWCKCEYLGAPLCQDGACFLKSWDSSQTPHVQGAWKKVWVCFLVFSSFQIYTEMYLFPFSFITMVCGFIITALTVIMFCLHYEFLLLSATGTHPAVQPTTPSGDIKITPQG